MSIERRVSRLCQQVILGFLVSLIVCTGKAAEPIHNFGNKPNTIDIGYGILATPMSVLGEVLRRDRVLLHAANEKGIEFRFHPFEKGADTIEPMLSGKLDATMPTETVALELVAKADMLMIGYVRQSFSSVIAPRGVSMRGLRGKRIGNAPGTSGHNALLQGLSAAGMTDKDVVLVTMNVREMPDALVAGKIDAFAAFEPTPSSFLKTYPGQFVPLHRQVSPAYLVIPRQLTDKQPEVVYLLLAAVQRTTRWLNRSRSNLDLASKWTINGMRDFLGKDPELDVRDIATLTRTDFLDISGVPFIPLRDKNVDSPLGRTFENLRKSGKLPASVEWQQVSKNIDNSMNRHVHDNSSRYKINEFDYSQ